MSDDNKPLTEFRDGEYGNLVDRLFLLDDLTITLKELRASEQDDFVNSFAAGSAFLKFKLRGWISANNLEKEFKSTPATHVPIPAQYRDTTTNKRSREFDPNARTRPTPIDTARSIGCLTMAELHQENLVTRLNGTPGHRAVLDAKQLGELYALANEHQVVAFLTPFFEAILGEDSTIQVVNSEENPWLVTTELSSTFNQKPDNIFCHNAMYKKREAFKTEDADLLRLRRNTNKFGILANWRLRDCIDAIGEAKVKIDHQGIGEVVNYARHICFEDGSPERTRLILYDKKEFWICPVVHGKISFVQQCSWDTPGSKQILKSFIEDGRSPWVRLLNAACDLWELTVESDAFLGMGSFGRVFKVTLPQEGRKKSMALKLVLPGTMGAGALELTQEKNALKEAAKVLPDGIANVHDFHNFGNRGAAMLMTHIGGEVPKHAWKQLFESLGRLHENNIAHGDPRLSNAIFVEGKARWIDFRSTVVHIDPGSPHLQRRDMEMLVNSCCYEGSLLSSPALKKAIEDYDGTPASAVLVFEALMT